ncbi:hypothetical protein DPMN_105308 [Dreissena polymorpha]|uniref:TIR domain-containing protein n=1 Tax=Dreissena polymorpha TaxID=45954 RepID=A0A9D4HEK8_DREPO|nr:hypothetical protein DPMN_105308 [Dreissena polymorpha]
MNVVNCFEVDIMSFILECGILGLLQILSGVSVIARRQPPGGPEIPELLILQCEYPIWHRAFHDRLMPDIYEEIKFEPEEFCSTIRLDINTKPWNQTSRRVESLFLTGIAGYSNQIVLKDIEGGYLGKHFKNIIYLGITDLPLRSVNKTMFEGLYRLKVLNFIVKVDFFPVDTFSGLSQLVYFRYQDSMLQNISSAHFCHNSQLAFVMLRRNLLKTVNGNLMQNCSGPTLNSFDLGGNNFSTLTAGMFKDYNVNGFLEISNCSISGVQSDVFIGLENLLALDLSNNLITAIPNGTFSRMNNSIQGIFMSNNFVSMINIEGIFGGFENIINLDLSSNQIHSIVGTFAILPNLFEMYFANNQLKTVHESLFEGLVQLHKLIIANNSIESIDKNAFNGLNVLQQLDLSYNRLTQLDPRQFSDLFKLKYVNLSNNNITTLNESIFEHNTALEQIHLSHNDLLDVGNLILNATNIRSINVSNNNLKYFPTLISKGTLPCAEDLLSKLVCINGSSNRIISLSLQCLSGIVLLDFSDNMLTQVPSLYKLPMLQELKLRHNKIKHVDVTFVELRALTILDLGDNLIESVSPKIFPESLKNLYLEHNKLKIFNIIDLSYLLSLKLRDNPLECSCENEDIFTWVRTPHTMSIDNVTCTSTSSGTITAAANFYPNHCDLFKRLKIIIPVASVSFILLIVCLIIFKFRYEIQVIAFYKWHVRLDFNFGKGRHRKPEDTYTYDAFVCFAEEDTPFVEETLRPLLEPQYSLCLYYRDFHVGDDIADAILKGIKRERSDHYIANCVIP